jgi:hypothetical protein
MQHRRIHHLLQEPNLLNPMAALLAPVLVQV